MVGRWQDPHAALIERTNVVDELTLHTIACSDTDPYTASAARTALVALAAHDSAVCARTRESPWCLDVGRDGARGRAGRPEKKL